MPLHIGVDRDSSLVQSLVEMKAKRHDSAQQEALLHGEKQIIGGKKGYADEKFKKSYRADDVIYAISDKPKRHYPMGKKNIIASY